MKRLRLLSLIGVFSFGIGRGGVAAAEQIPHDQYAGTVYVIRDFYDPTPKDENQGIWRMDPDRGIYHRFRSLYWGEILGLRAAMSAFPDRLVVQGESFVEFELPTGRLLRRYNALPSEFGDWAFQGTLVTEEAGRVAGILPGYYGFPICLPNAGIVSGCNPPVISPPGYSTHGGRTQFSYLHRRGVDPAQKYLDLVWLFDPPYSSSSSESRTRQITFDEHAGAFWVWNQGVFLHSIYQHIERLTLLSLKDRRESVVAEKFVEVLPAPPDSARRSVTFSYLPAERALLHTFLRLNASEPELTRVAIPGLEETTIPNPSMTALPSAIAAVPSTLPSTYQQTIPLVIDPASVTSGRRRLVARSDAVSWRSSIWFFNPSDVAITVRVRSVSQPSRSRELSLPPRGSMRLDRPLQWLGVTVDSNAPAVDALAIESPYHWGEQLAISTKIYRSSPFPGEAGGTYSFSAPSVPGSTGYSTHLAELREFTDLATFHSQFFLDQREAAADHTIGVVNDSDEPLRVLLKYGHWLPGNHGAADYQTTIAPHSVGSIEVEQVFPADLIEVQRAAVWIAAERPAPVWVLSRDRKTGDRFFVPNAQFVLQPASSDRIALPLVAGSGHDVLNTDIYGWFYPPPAVPITTPRRPFHQVHGELYLPDGSKCLPPGGLLTAIAGVPAYPDEPNVNSIAKHIYPDVVRQFQDCPTATSGALEVNANSWMAGFARIYIDHPQGGSYGDALPFFPMGGWPVQHLAGIEIEPNMHEIELGFYNGTDRAASYQLRLSGQSGQLETTINLAPRESLRRPIAELFPDFANGTYGLTVDPQDESDLEGRSWAYAIVRDRITGDFRFLY